MRVKVRRLPGICRKFGARLLLPGFPLTDRALTYWFVNPYSALSAIMGSTREALQAGTSTAMSDTAVTSMKTTA